MLNGLFLVKCGLHTGSGGVRHWLGAKLPTFRLAPKVKYSGQESRSELCEILMLFRSFQSKFVKNVCKLLQLLTPYRGFAPGPHWGTYVPRRFGYSSQRKIIGADTAQWKFESIYKRI